MHQIQSHTLTHIPMHLYHLESFQNQPTNQQREYIDPLAPNDVYISRTVKLTSRRCILNIYSTNILTEYFKHAAHSPFFFSLSSRCRLFHNQNAGVHKSHCDQHFNF